MVMTLATQERFSNHENQQRHFQFRATNPTKYENPKTQTTRHTHLRCRGRHVLCGWLRRDGIRKHNIAAVGGWLPRRHAANAKATATLCCSATLHSPARDSEGKILLRL